MRHLSLTVVFLWKYTVYSSVRPATTTSQVTYMTGICRLRVLGGQDLRSDDRTALSKPTVSPEDSLRYQITNSGLLCIFSQSDCLCQLALFLGGHRSDWMRADPSDLIFI